MSTLIRGLTWPIVALLVIGSTHLIAELIRPELRELMSTAVVMPIYLVAGGWAAYATHRAGGGLLQVPASAAILGILPLALQIVGFGMILGRGLDGSLTAGLFGLLAVFWGGALGAGIAKARGESAAR